MLIFSGDFRGHSILILNVRLSQCEPNTYKVQSYWMILLFPTFEKAENFLLLPETRLIQIYGSASNINIAGLKAYQSIALRLLSSVPWYFRNETLHTDLKISYVSDVKKLL